MEQELGVQFSSESAIGVRQDAVQRWPIRIQARHTQQVLVFQEIVRLVRGSPSQKPAGAAQILLLVALKSSSVFIIHWTRGHACLDKD